MPIVRDQNTFYAVESWARMGAEKEKMKIPSNRGTCFAAAAMHVHHATTAPDGANEPPKAQGALEELHQADGASPRLAVACAVKGKLFHRKISVAAPRIAQKICT